MMDADKIVFSLTAGTARLLHKQGWDDGYAAAKKATTKRRSRLKLVRAALLFISGAAWGGVVVYFVRF